MEEAWYYHGHGSSVILLPSPWYYRGSTSRWFGGIILYVNWKRFLSFADHIDRSHSHQIFQCDTIRIYSILFWIMHMTKSFPQLTSFIQKKKYRDKKIFCVSAASGKVCQTLFSIHIRQKKVDSSRKPDSNSGSLPWDDICYLNRRVATHNTDSSAAVWTHARPFTCSTSIW